MYSTFQKLADSVTVYDNRQHKAMELIAARNLSNLENLVSRLSNENSTDDRLCFDLHSQLSTFLSDLVSEDNLLKVWRRQARAGKTALAQDTEKYIHAVSEILVKVNNESFHAGMFER